MPVTAPTSEIGYTLAPTYNRMPFDDGETTPELVWPQSIYVYDAMRKQDAQVGSVLRAVTETLLRTPWRIDPAGAKARVTKFVADDLGLPVVGKNPTPPPRLKDRFSWPSHLREALLMLPMGHAYFEQVYRITDDGKAAHLRKLAYRPAKTLEQINVASDGGLISIQQYWTATNRKPEPIPVDHLVAYIHAKEGGNWLGTSILRNCYKNWLLKDRLLRVQAQTIERNGMGIPLYTAAETETDLTKGLGMATSWRAGEAAGSAVPFGASLKLVGVEGTLPDAMPVVEYHDSQIARAVLAHFLNLGQQTGSWALGTTFADFFTMSLQTLAEQIRDTATQHIVEDLVDHNFGPDEPAPRLVFDEIGSRQAPTAAAIKTLVDAGVLHPDQVLEESSRQQYGLPPADPATATLPPGQQGVMEPDPTQMGDMSPSVAASADPKGRGEAEERYDDEADDWEDAIDALILAFDELSAERVEAAFNPKQARNPKGSPGAGRFRSMVDRLKDAITEHGKGGGKAHPFDGFDREQLRRVARAQGIELKRGESRDSIAEKLLGRLGQGGPKKVSTPPVKKVAPKKAAPHVPTWEELGKPPGPAPVGQVIGHEGGTYERLPGEPRRYRVVSVDGRDISDQMYGASDPTRGQTAEGARTALRMDAYDRKRVTQDETSTWRKTLGAVTGSWNYSTGDIEGFGAASTPEHEAIRDALKRWTGDKAGVHDATRRAEPRVNTAIRGATPRTRTVDQDIHALDSAFGMSKTKRSITVYRGFSNGAHILPEGWQTRDLTGLEWSTEGFTPTSADETVAEEYVGFAEHRGFGIRLKLPKGSPAIAIPDALGGMDNEGEIVLPRGLTFRVIKDRGAEGDLELRWLDVELVADADAPKPPAKRARAGGLFGSVVEGVTDAEQFDGLTVERGRGGSEWHVKDTDGTTMATLPSKKQALQARIDSVALRQRGRATGVGPTMPDAVRIAQQVDQQKSTLAVAKGRLYNAEKDRKMLRGPAKKTVGKAERDLALVIAEAQAKLDLLRTRLERANGLAP